MRELSVSFTNDGKAVVGSVPNFQDEHCAVCLAVTLSSDLTAGEPDEYYIGFVRDADLDNPMPQKLIAGPVQDIREGVLYFELPSALTNTTCLAAQLEAVKTDANGEVVSLVKSPPFLIRLNRSLQGEEGLAVSADADSLLARLLDATAQAVALNQTVSTALEQGTFLARINGHNTVTIQGGRNLTLTDRDGAMTFDCVTLPVVTALPEDPQEGETVLLIPRNEITSRESGRELTTGAALLAAAAAEEMQRLTEQTPTRCPFYYNLRKSGALVGFVGLTSDLEEGEAGEKNKVSTLTFITKLQNNLPNEGCEIAFVNGVFSTERSYFLKRGRSTAMNVIPSAIRLPEFDTVEIMLQEGIAAPVFFCPTALMAYCGQWIEITSLAADKHFHSNLATIEGFFCDASEAIANTPAGQPVIALDYTGWDRLRWGEAEVRMASDGGVIHHVETVTVSGRSFLRLWLNYGEVNAPVPGPTHPSFIDIPVDSANSSTATQGGQTVNGTALDLGVNSVAEDVVLLEQEVASIQPDWGENDPTDRAYVANRTHWAAQETVYETYTVGWLTTAPSTQLQPWDADELGVALAEGECYTLQVGGDSFIGTCQKTTATVNGTVQETFYVGNPHLYDPNQEDNGFPLLLIYDVVHTDPVGTRNVLLTEGSLFGSDLTFRLGQEETVYHKLSVNYLPDGLTDAIQHEHVHAAQSHASSFSGRLKANCFTCVGSSAVPASSVTVTGFDSAGSGLISEYLLKFHSGATPTTLTLPASVVWADELTVEADKAYEISILDDLALWCAVDEEASV